MGFFSRLMGGSDEQKTATSEFEILAPVSGELVHLENTNDPAFSSRAVGDGVAVVPQEGTVCAPVSGTVAALFPTEAYRTKCVSTLGASAQVDAPFSAV